MTLNWIKHFSNGSFILGLDDTSWSQTKLDEMVGLTVCLDGKHTHLAYGPGEYHYEEDWEVTVGQQDHKLICKRIVFTPPEGESLTQEFYTNGTVS